MKWGVKWKNQNVCFWVCLDIQCLSSDADVLGVSVGCGYGSNEVYNELLVSTSEKNSFSYIRNFSLCSVAYWLHRLRIVNVQNSDQIDLRGS